ncbi:MAG: hypothetical protein AAF641_07610 [Pseudomonadota bacterium]
MTSENQLAKLVDELGGLRIAIRTLKAREAEIRSQLINARPNADVDGCSFTLTIRKSNRRRFDHTALPDHIRNDTRHWMVTETTVVVTKPFVPASPRHTPGRILPARVPPAHGQNGYLFEDRDDFQVIEPF